MKKRLIGIDYGMARIGVAHSDLHQIIATPMTTLINPKKSELAAKLLLQQIQPLDVEEIVVGMPYRLNGSSSFSTDETRHFIEELQKLTEIPIRTWDERLTTVQVERAMKEGNMSRKKRSQKVDAACATLILQSYLDQKANSLVGHL